MSFEEMKRKQREREKKMTSFQFTVLKGLLVSLFLSHLFALRNVVTDRTPKENFSEK
jgi:hypothetical protein